MQIIRNRGYARAALVGNPSDGYHGKTIALLVRNFWAETVLYEWDSLEIVLADDDRAKFSSVQDLAKDVTLHGYYGGIRLVKATIKRFVEYCRARDISLHGRNFSVRYETRIPRQVGMAGSSAIIVATLRSLMEFYGVSMPIEIQPAFVLSVEREELGIAAGLQDRVIQVYEGLVYMDFGRNRERIVEGLPCYHYERLDRGSLPQLYLSYHSGLSEPTEVFHNDIRGRYARGDVEVIAGMEQAASLAAAARDAIVRGDARGLASLIDENFEVRRRLFKLPAWQVEMIDTARACGASANFAGSGGAIVGTYDGEAMFHRLRSAMDRIHCRTIRPL